MQHRTHRNACRTAATAAVLLLGVALVPPIAGAAGLGGKAVGTESVTAATWGVTASVTTMTFTSNTYQTSTITNTGTLALVAESYSVTVSNPASGSPTFKVFQCAVAWWPPSARGRRHPGRAARWPRTRPTTITSTTAMAVGGRPLPPGRAGRGHRVDHRDHLDQVAAPTQLRAAVKTNQ